MAALDPTGFLRSVPPFDALPEALFEDSARRLEVGFFPKGTELVRAGGAPLEHLYVIRKGAVRLERAGQAVQVLEDGEIFGYTSLITGQASFDVVVDEDLLAYRLPGEVFRRLLSDAAFASHFAEGLGERLRASLADAPVAAFPADLTTRVEELVRRPAVWVEAGATAGEAAAVMSREHISSVLVRGEPPAIVTDRDLRNRVLGLGLGPDVPVARIASRPLRTVPAEMPLFDAWVHLLEAGLHHLPVSRGGQVIGVLTSTDVLRSTAQGPLAVLRGVDRLASRESLPGYAAKVAEMTSALLGGGLGTTAIAALVARLNDALLRRIAAWAEADLGPPPAPYALLVLGSEGRMEQTLLTDQDNALVFADPGASNPAWYAAFADRVNADLEAAGFPRCAGGYMARHWCGPLAEWLARFQGWLDVPTPQAILVSCIFFDFRCVAGSLDLAPLQSIVDQAPRRPLFLRLLAADALQRHPPPGLLLRLRGESSTVDLKAHGIAPIVALARRYALEAGSAARGTLERLGAAASAGLLPAEAQEALGETYRFLLELRLRLQLRAIAAGRPVSNRMTLSEVSSLERSRLKDALRALRSWQEKAAYQFGVEA